MTTNPYQLVIKTGPNPGEVYSLTKSEIFLGRDISNDIVINDAEVSRKHARMTFQEDQYILEDLGSTNGTFINGVRITKPHRLTLGETIQLGENISMVFNASFDPDATVAVSQRPPQVAAPRPVTYPPHMPSQEPTYNPMPGASTSKSSNRLWLIGGIGCLLIFLCAIVPGLILWWIDAQNLWCTILPSLAGCP